ncbi:MAG TPA: rod shape-determining protein MreC, partial [Nitrosomonas europaea]|nr:rod shape-determining protein MreC [Nitrosomonas europaea]
MHTPPQFFKVGPSPLTRMFFFVLLSVFIMIADSRSDFIAEARRVIGVAISPLQKLAYLPFSLQEKVDQYISDFKLIEEIDHLRREYLTSRHDFFRLQALASENEHLRALLGAARQTEIQTVLAEILYTP